MRLPLLVLTLSALAGCAGGSAPAAPEDAAGPAPAAGNATIEPPQHNVTVGPNPPAAALQVSVEGLAAVFNVSVGPGVVWHLDADGDKTPDHNGSAEAHVEHAYEAAGTYLATLHAANGTAWTNITQNVTVAPQYLPGQHAEGSFPAGGATLIGCFGDLVGVGFPEDLDGVLYSSFAVEPHTIGYGYTTSVSATAQDSPGFAFLDAAWEVVTSGFMSTHATGTVPEGAAYGVWWTCLGAQMSGTYDSSPPS